MYVSSIRVESFEKINIVKNFLKTTEERICYLVADKDLSEEIAALYKD